MKLTLEASAIHPLFLESIYSSTRNPGWLFKSSDILPKTFAIPYHFLTSYIVGLKWESAEVEGLVCVLCVWSAIYLYQQPVTRSSSRSSKLLIRTYKKLEIKNVNYNKKKIRILSKPCISQHRHQYWASVEPLNPKNALYRIFAIIMLNAGHLVTKKT